MYDVGTMFLMTTPLESRQPSFVAASLSLLHTHVRPVVLRRLAAFIAVLFVAGAAAAQDGPQVLRVTPPAGAEYVFAVTTRTDAVNAAGTYQMDLTLTQRVQAIGDRDVTWLVKTAIDKLSSEGVFVGIENALRALDGLEMTKVVDRRGQTTSLTVGGQNVPASGTPDVTFPENAVAPGDHWIAEVDSNGRKARIRYTFKGRSTVSGRPSLLIEGQFEPGQFATSVEPALYHLDPADGLLISVAGVMQMDIDGKVMRVRFSVTRVPAKTR